MLRAVRARTTLTAVGVMSAAVAIASLALVILLQRSLLRDVDARAAVRLHDLVALAERNQVPRVLAGVDEDSTVAQLVADNRIVAQSPAIREGVVIADFAPNGSGIETRSVANAPIVGGGTYRVAVQRVTAPNGPAVAYAGASVEPVIDSMHTVEVLLAIVGPALVILTGGMTWWLVGRTLDPVEAIRREVAEISASGLARRVPERPTGDEIQRLAQTMNSMLARLDDAASRQRQFVSDAAHELRSPVAAIRAELDLAIGHPNDVDWTALLDRLTASSARLERLVDDLFVLATADEQLPPRRIEVDLDEVVLRQVESLLAASGHVVEATTVDAARVLGDRHQLERVVATCSTTQSDTPRAASSSSSGRQTAPPSWSSPTMALAFPSYFGSGSSTASRGSTKRGTGTTAARGSDLPSLARSSSITVVRSRWPARPTVHGSSSCSRRRRR